MVGTASLAVSVLMVAPDGDPLATLGALDLEPMSARFYASSSSFASTGGAAEADASTVGQASLELEVDRVLLLRGVARVAFSVGDIPFCRRIPAGERGIMRLGEPEAQCLPDGVDQVPRFGEVT